MNPISDSPPLADEALQPLKAGDERFIAALRVSHGAKENPRRNVIDKLPWTAFCWNEGVIRIEATEFFRQKSHEPEGDVLVARVARAIPQLPRSPKKRIRHRVETASETHCDLRPLSVPCSSNLPSRAIAFKPVRK